MRNFDIKKAWPVAVAAAGVALSGQVQAGITSGLPLPGIYTAALIGSGTSYYLQVGQHVNYTPVTGTASSALAISTTTGMVAVDLKATSTASTWNFSLTANGITTSAGALVGTATLTTVWAASTTTTCTVTYELTQDFGSQALTLQNATVSSVSLTSGKATTSTDTTACNTSFNGRTGLVMAQNPAKTITYSLIY